MYLRLFFINTVVCYLHIFSQTLMTQEDFLVMTVKFSGDGQVAVLSRALHRGEITRAGKGFAAGQIVNKNR